MPKFTYKSTREMEPVPGRNYSTTYYKQNPRERQRTKDFVDSVYNGMQALTDTDSQIALDYEMPDFKKRESAGCYSTREIITLMHDQMKKGNDIPSGMLGRWNRLFEGSDNTIDLVPETPTGNTFHNLFGKE